MRICGTECMQVIYAVLYVCSISIPVFICDNIFKQCQRDHCPPETRTNLFFSKNTAYSDKSGKLINYEILFDYSEILVKA